jgi:hypothetical protein
VVVDTADLLHHSVSAPPTRYLYMAGPITLLFWGGVVDGGRKGVLGFARGGG